MSYITCIYPEPVERDYTHNRPWQVREDVDYVNGLISTWSIYAPVPVAPLEHAARISAKLISTVTIEQYWTK